MTNEEFETLRRPHIEAVEMLKTQYMKACEPYLKRLADLESLRPLRWVLDGNSLVPIGNSCDQARSGGYEENPPFCTSPSA